MNTLSQRIAGWAASVTIEDIPDEVVTRARHLFADAMGVALAARGRDFVDMSLAASAELGEGTVPVIGRSETLSRSGACITNGLLIHGLDYDDTHIPSVTHVSASVLAGLISAAHEDDTLTVDDFLRGYIVAVEVSARLGIAANGMFHDRGFHPTGVVGAFGTAVGIGVMLGRTADQLTAAQGVVGSFASGLMQFLDEGAWTKRLHPGWAANAAFTANAYARTGFIAPLEIYEGRFGLYATHIQRDTPPDLSSFDTLGSVWEIANVSVKPFPTCHFTHSFIDIAMDLKRANGLDVDQIESIDTLIHPTPGAVVGEPIEAKHAPSSEYDAKFSLPYVVASSLHNDRLTSAELADDARADAAVLALTRKVNVGWAEDSLYPRAFSGDVTIRMSSGDVFHGAEQVNRGHQERPLSNEEIVEKFKDNASSPTADIDAETMLGRILGDTGSSPAADLISALSAR